MAVIMLSNTNQRGALGGQNPVLSAKVQDAVESTPGASWSEITFGTAFEATGSCVDITADVGLRFFAGASAPSAGAIGWLIPAGQVRTLAVFPGDRLFMKAA